MAATTDLLSLMRFTAPSLPGELAEARIIELLAELQRRGEATGQELLEVLEPTMRSARRRAVALPAAGGASGGSVRLGSISICAEWAAGARKPKVG
jgi:hypothetical protein